MQLATILVLCFAAGVIGRNPGYVIRATNSGLQYAAQVGGEVVGQLINKVSIPPISFKTTGLSLTIEGIKIGSFTGAKWAVDLTAPSTVILRLSSANLDAKGNFKGKVLLSKVSGGLEAMADGIGINVAIALGADPNGRPTVTETSCAASTSKFDIKLTGSFFIKTINLFHKQIANAVKPDILNAICSEVQTVVNTNLQQVLSTLPTVIDLGSGFGIDYRLLSVVVRKDFVEVSGRGEIDYQGKNTYPYDASPIDRSGATDSLMAYFWGSEFILTSAAWQLQRSGILNLNVTKDKVPEAAKLLETTCAALCVGTIIKEIGEEYPGTYTGLYLQSSSIPVMSITPDGGSLSARGSVDLSVHENGTYVNLAGADLNITADVVAALVGNNITGKVTVTQMQIAGTYSILEDPVNWEFLAHLAQNILQNEINHLLSPGIPIPSFDGITIVNPYLALKQKTLEVAANVHYQPQ